MPIDPTIALQTRPMPNPLEQYSQAIGIQQQQIQLQQQKQALKDQQTLRDLFVKNQGDLDKVIKDAPGAGVSPNTLIQLQQHSLDVKTKLSQLTGEQLKNSATQNDNLIGVLKPVQDAPADKKAEVYQASYTKVLQNPQMYGITDPSQIPQQYPGDEAIKQQILLHQGGKTQFENAMKEREVGAQEQAAQARGGVDMALYLSLLKQGKTPQEAFAQVKQQGQQGKQPPLPTQQIENLNKIFTDRYQVLNPGKPLPPQYALQTGATQKDADTIDKGLEQVEKATATKVQQQTNQGTKSTARTDKSYEFNSNQLEKVAQPVDQAVARMGRLKDALAQKTPQADALIAPELLSVMAGGAGSGLRMNEAEISRIVGGKNVWENLKSKMLAFQADPSKPFLITPEQRRQIGALVQEVDNKLKAKQAALQGARDALLNTDDPGEHRRIVAKARSTMTDVDAGKTQGETSKPLEITLPSGKKIKID